MYYSLALQECRNCPSKSESHKAGLYACPCIEGYYRTLTEDDLHCTRKILNSANNNSNNRHH